MGKRITIPASVKRLAIILLVLAVIVFMIMLTSFNYWWDDYLRFLTGG